MKAHIYPLFGGEDKGDGGIRRVVEAQQRYLPALGVELVDDPTAADIIICHAMTPPNYWTVYPEKVFVVHNYGLYWSEYEWQRWALKANADCMESIRRADAVTAPSEWVAQNLRRHTARQVTVLSLGVALEDWEPGENEGYVLWNKTRPDPVCDPAPLNALARLMPETQFVTTFGDMASNVKVTGRLPFAEAKHVLRNAGVYLCTTRETFGLGTLEALACGVPVVGYDWSSQAELLTHGKNAWLVEPGNIEGLAEGVRWALANRESIAAAGKEVAEGLSWQRSMATHAKFYRGLLAKRAGPKVGVIVTAYGVQEFLGECLDSVLAQTMQDWECIVVDDASPDGSGALADEYAASNSRIRVIHNAENRYVGEARNIGMAESKGKYIIPLDGDDALTPDALQVLSDALDSDRSIHIAYGNLEILAANGKRLHSGWPIEFNFEWQAKQRNLLPYCAMFRRQVWEDTGGYRNRWRTGEDAEFWLRAASYGYRPHMVTTADILVYRMGREGSLTNLHPQADWAKWLACNRDIEASPAGAVTDLQLPVPSLDPPAVAVVIPVGPGHEHYLLDAIDSVDAQTFRQWECIVVNDTGGLLGMHLPSWVRVVTPARNRGVAAARNLGIRAARAPLVVPLDADDYLQPDYLKAVLWAHDESGGDIIYTDFWEDPEIEGEFRIFREHDSDPLEVFNGGLPVTMLLPKAAWEQVGGFDETLPAWEDWDFQIACNAVGVCFTRLAAPLWSYRKHTGKRRDDDYARFEEGKEGILRKWGAYWRGEKTLMGCGGCGQKKTLNRQNGQRLHRDLPPPEGAVLVEYTGGKAGAVGFRGPSGTLYRFAAGEGPKYVLAQDAPFFDGRMEFRRVDQMAVADQPDAPQLVAEGPPAAVPPPAAARRPRGKKAVPVA